MQAIRFHHFGGPDVMRLEQVDTPPVLPPGHVRIRMQAAGVAQVDAKMRAGLLQQYFTLALPKIPGRDGVGIVEEVADACHDFAVGDAVCVLAGLHDQGSYAQSMVLPVERVVRKPECLSVRQAAVLLQPGVSAWIPVMQTAAVQPGMKVLVHAGSGAVGSLMVRLAVHLGADVWTTCHSTNVEYVQSLGTQQVLAYDRDDFSALRDVDVVFDLVGGATHDRSYPLLKRGGLLVWLAAAPIVARGDAFGVQVRRAMITDAHDAMREVAALAQQGVFLPEVGQAFPLAQAAQAHALLESGLTSRGRLVLDID